MRIRLEISEQEVQESVRRALQETGRRLSVVDWVIRDLTGRVPFDARSQKVYWAMKENFKLLVAEAVRAKGLTNEAFEAELTDRERNDIIAGWAVLSSDGGKYHAVYQ